MSPPLWSQMSIVTSFFDHVIIPSFDAWNPSTVIVPMYRPYKENVGAYCLMTSSNTCPSLLLKFVKNFHFARDRSNRIM